MKIAVDNDLMNIRLPFFGIVLFVLSCSCKMAKHERALFQLMDNTGINFQNNVEDDSLENSFLFRNFYNGGGVAIGDLNNDGLADVFLTSNAGANKLYLNKGNFQFDDISDKAGIIQDDKWNTGVVFADVNGDGWLDIYVCCSGHMGTGNRKNKLYINNHDLTFTESAAKYGLDISAYTTQVSFFDYDMDGDQKAQTQVVLNSSIALLSCAPRSSSTCFLSRIVLSRLSFRVCSQSCSLT